MEENVASLKNISIKWGVVYGLVSIILFVLIDVLGLISSPGIQFLGVPIVVLILVLSHREFKAEGDGFMSYGQGLGLGTLLSLIASVISSAFSYVYISFINTSYIDVIKENQIMQLESRGMSDAEIEQALSFSESFMTPTAIAIMGVFMGLLSGFIISLIVTIFTKKSRPDTI